MRRLLLVILIFLFFLLPLKAQDFSLADILTQSASADNAELTILLFALGQADTALVQQLNDPNANLTILAPSDAAFISFMAENGLSLQDLVDNPLLLNALVRYHILPESLSSSEISASASIVSSFAANPIAISTQRNRLRLNGTAQIVREGFVANNGILHLIDTVLVPPTVQNMLANLRGETPTASMSIVEILQSREDLSTLTLALEQNGLLETFADSSQNFTLFAPTNAAFEAAGLNAEDITSAMLLYHAFDTILMGAELSQATSQTTLQGAEMQISYAAGTIGLNEQGVISEMDILASNGVLHLVNALLSIPTSP